MRQVVFFTLILISFTTGISAQFNLSDNRIYGGNGFDEARKFAAASNNVVHFFGGTSFSNDGDVPGNFGGTDFWVMKRSADGDLLWSKNLGGGTNDDLVSIMPHPDGGVIAFGTTRSSQGEFGEIVGLTGGWVVRTNNNGDIIDGRIFGGQVTELAVDAFRRVSGNVVLALESGSGLVDGQPNLGVFDSWIVNISPTFEIEWSRRSGGSGADSPKAIAGDINSNTYVAASTDGNIDGLDDNRGQDDAWIYKLAPNGDLLWQVMLGGTNDDIPTDIIYHEEGYVYAIIQSNSNDFDFPLNRGINDLWLVQIDANTGDVLQSTPYGGPGNDYNGRLSLIGDDRIIVSASTTSSSGDLTGSKGFSDVWIFETDLNGSILKQMNYGGSVNDLAADVFVTDTIIHVLSTSTSSDKNVPFSTFAQSDLWYFSLNTKPDSCATDLVCLSDSTLNNELFPPDNEQLICASGCTAGYGRGPNAGADCNDFVNPTVYYKITTDTSADLVTLSIHSFEFNKPQIAIFSSPNCITYFPLECAIGANGEVVLDYVDIEPETQYVIAISDAEGNIGDFELCVTSVDVEFCNQSDDLYATSTSMGSPLNGPYKPGEAVQFCYELTSWNKRDCNGFQGLMPTFGAGWDPESFGTDGQPVEMDTFLMPVENGIWQWHTLGQVRYNLTNPISGFSSGQGMPPGWYFTNLGDPPPTGGPDQTTGDINDCQPTNDSWKVCFTLTALDECETNLDLSIRMKTFSDGELGINSNLACAYDQEEIFNTYLQCCLNPHVDQIQDFVRCTGDTTLLLPETNLIEPVTFNWTSEANEFISGNTNANGRPFFEQILVNDAAIPFDVHYKLWATGNGCITDTVEFDITVNPLPTASFDLTGPFIVCAGTPVTLHFEGVGTPPFVIQLLRDFEPFIEILSENPTITVEVDPQISSRLTIGEVTDALCTGSGTGFEDVVIKPEFITQIDSVVCEGGSVTVGDSTFTSSGTYQYVFEKGAENNCDSTVILTLEIVPTITQVIDEVICNGDTLFVLSTPYTESINTIIEYQTPEGCPAFIDLNLEVRDTFSTDINQTICFGDTLEFGGIKVFQSGTYSHVEEVRPMCFEESILNLTVLPELFEEVVIISPDNGSGNGSIIFEVGGGSPPYTYQWSSGQEVSSIFNVTHGEYTITVTDRLGCRQVFVYGVPFSNSVGNIVGDKDKLLVRPTVTSNGQSIQIFNTGNQDKIIESINWYSVNGQNIKGAGPITINKQDKFLLNVPERLGYGLYYLQIRFENDLVQYTPIIIQ